MITPEQVQDVVKLRTDLHALISKGVNDEYLLATYNGIVRRLDDRLPKIRERSEGKTYKAESRDVVKKQREAMSRKNGATSGPAPTSSKKAS